MNAASLIHPHPKPRWSRLLQGKPLISLGISLGLVCSLALPLSQPAVASPLQEEIETLLEQDLAGNRTDIQAKAAELTEAERLALYSHYEKSPLNASLLNLLPLFGYGSYQQGDLVGGISLSVLDGVSVALLALSFLPSNRAGEGWGAAMMLGSSLLTFGLGRVVGVTSPIVHAAVYNHDLHQALEPQRQSTVQSGQLFGLAYSF
ncbi:MAG: P13 family porin [Candidatus Sericytochromatia bacterium]